MPRTAEKPDVPPNQRELVDLPTLAALIELHPETVAKAVSLGTFPPPIKIGPNRGAARWRWREIQAWLADGAPPPVEWTWDQVLPQTLEEKIQAKRAEIDALTRDLADLQAKHRRLEAQIAEACGDLDHARGRRSSVMEGVAP